MKQSSKNIPKSNYLGKLFWVINSENFQSYLVNMLIIVLTEEEIEVSRKKFQIKGSLKDTVSVEFIFKIVADSLSLVFICCNNLLFSPVACCSFLQADANSLLQLVVTCDFFRYIFD